MTELERLTEIVRESSRVNRSNGAVRMEVPHNVCEQIVRDTLSAMKDAPDNVIDAMWAEFSRSLLAQREPSLRDKDAAIPMRAALIAGIDKILGEVK